MSAVRFYVDEHVSRAVVRALRVRGADVRGLGRVHSVLDAEEMRARIEFL